MSAPLQLVSVREFARLDGCDEKLVRNAVKAGKLPVSVEGKLDSALAGSDWRRRNRRAAEGADKAKKSAAPRELDDSELGDVDFIAEVLAGRFQLTGTAERVKENALAANRLLATRKAAGDLVDLEVAEAVLFEQARQFRDAWQNWPVRVGPLIAAELGVPADPVVEALAKYVTELLNDLGEPDPDFVGTDEG